MFIQIHYGEKKTLIVNYNSKLKHIFDYIREKCDLVDIVRFDLCNFITSEPKRLMEQPSLNLNAQTLFTQREQLILMKIDECDQYIPLLNDPDYITPDYLNKLRKATKMISFTGSTLKTRKLMRKVLTPTPVPTPIPTTDQQDVKPRRRSLKAVAIVARFHNYNNNSSIAAKQQRKT
ncbi:unnamed protein product [Didymodactylos carnosus]|uniref:Uncharacterized protein n=2 Tax=Didymodactylos carnosus TaxID=1234261 RepID=A0A814NBZ8_9BILA|nr:unnamed protein product [Didymodactylos carnosus]CAF3856947.1 unnamed protein product [Didymodactylos carnosus]